MSDRTIKCAACTKRDALVRAAMWADQNDPVPDCDEPMTWDEVLLVTGQPCEHVDTRHDGDERTLNEVGDILGLSRERIRQIETQLLARLECHRQLRAQAGKENEPAPSKAIARAMRSNSSYCKRTSGVRHVFHAGARALARATRPGG